MKKFAVGMMLLGSIAAFAHMSSKEAFNYMKEVLPGQWTLSPASKQIGTTGAHNHPAVKRLLGTDKTGVEYTVIGSGSAIKEELLPDTIRWMVTMYHCDHYPECNKLLATHYCAKKNQPSFVFNEEESTPKKLVFDCDEERSEVCDSDESHVHHIILELSNNNKHLKASYIVYKNGERANTHSIYHFDKRSFCKWNNMWK
ncbi:hypothetical protein [Nitratiruptor sp. SB155-2]|uniref:hypothetical protein n=1 Tax=Nitratiruptor sp. (strain SB155-2) TaxID=387092 RepID=UPI000158713A|nr:hypothetical protein [Nitratiruptor sp. SB155-2]BAF70319.1 hypothetical protein NIS_1210 [Nitratiruptor sp. SB155-2]